MRIRPWILVWIAAWTCHWTQKHGKPQTYSGEREFESKEKASQFLARCPDCVAGMDQTLCCDKKKLKEKDFPVPRY
jgi:hypothetical protein